MMDIDFSFSAIMSGFIFGVVGFYLMKEGRKRVNYAWVMIGIALMVYPILVGGHPLLQWGLGFGLCAIAYQYR
jgi:hypothetical protein